MGGGPPMPYPKWVWTPAGGWYCHPKNWKANTMRAGVLYAATVLVVFNLSRSLERRPVPPIYEIPSQSWCKFASEDDPERFPKSD